MIPMYIVSAICVLLCVPPVAPPIVPPRDLDEFARSRENRESAEVTNAKSMLRIQSDDDLARLSAYLIRLGVSKERANTIINPYRTRRDAAISEYIAINQADPGTKIFAEHMARIREKWPQGHPENAVDEPGAEHWRDVEQRAFRATAESTTELDLHQMGLRYKAALVALAVGARDAIVEADAAQERSAFRLHCTILSGYLEGPADSLAPPRAFEPSLYVVKFLAEFQTTSPVIGLDEYGLVSSADENLVPLIDAVYERARDWAWTEIHPAERSQGPQLMASKVRTHRELLAAKDRLVDAAAVRLEALGASEDAVKLRAQYLQQLAPTVLRESWIETELAGCIGALRAAEAISGSEAESFEARRAVTLQELARLRACTIDAGWLWRRNYGVSNWLDYRDQVIAAMRAFDAFNLREKAWFVDAFPAGWPTICARRISHEQPESSLDEIAKRRVR